MSTRTRIPVFALLLAVAVPSLAWAGSETHAACAFKAHQVTAVRPYQVEEQIGRGTIQRLRGAELYIKAEKGLTAQWLQLTLQEHIGHMNAPVKGHCVLGVNDVRVTVEPAGAGFAVKIIAKDEVQGKEVLRRAEALAR
jgi:hypothetical protein